MTYFYSLPNYDAMSKKAAAILAAQVIMKPTSVLGLATGSSPEGMYAELARMCAEGLVTFSKARSFNLDEYVGLAPLHEQSYRYFMNKNFFLKVDMPAKNSALPNGLAADIPAECEQYDKSIEAAGGIDLQVLGLGRNGHIGFNEPGDCFIPGTHCVTLAPSTIEANSRFFASADEVPRQALSMGIRSIMNARKILLLAAGSVKAEILERAFFGPITPQVPASILQLHPDVTLCGDADAMAKIADLHPEVLSV